MFDIDRFEPKPGSAKLCCKICGRTGYQGGRWMDKCRQPHDYECHLCDKRYPIAQALGTHRARAHTHRYACAACGQVVTRQEEEKTIDSYCETTGKNVRMRKLN